MLDSWFDVQTNPNDNDPNSFQKICALIFTVLLPTAVLAYSN